MPTKKRVPRRFDLDFRNPPPELRQATSMTPASRRGAWLRTGPRHPLEPKGSTLMHDDFGNSDASESTGPEAQNSALRYVSGKGKFAGMMPTLAYVEVASRRYLLAASFGTERGRLIPSATTRLVAFREDGSEVATTVEIPGRPRLAKRALLYGKASLYRTTASGAYLVAIKHAPGGVELVVPSLHHTLWFVGFDGNGFGKARALTLDGKPTSLERARMPPAVLWQRMSREEKQQESGRAGPHALIATLPVWPSDPTTDAFWWVSNKGLVGVADRVREKAAILDLNDPAVNPQTTGAERIDNSLAVGPKGAFVVTTAALYRFVYREGRVRLVWRLPYTARSTQRGLGRLNAVGSGTTPTLLGTDYVAFTDGAEHMHVVVVDQGPTTDVWMDAGRPSNTPRSASYAVFGTTQGVGHRQSGCENSLVAYQRSQDHGQTWEWRLIVGNTWGYLSPFESIMRRDPDVLGVECLRVKDGQFGPEMTRSWAQSLCIGTAVPKLSLQQGRLYVYAYEKKAGDAMSWSILGLDVENEGEVGLRHQLFDDLAYDREHDNTWGTLVLTGGGLAVAAWRGLRWLEDVS